jgi:mannosyl-oligosaccharide alpha-1,2-mannosidase
MMHAWKGYEEYAWGYDELDTIGLKGRDDFSGLGATIVDSLDTLWIMGLKEEFARAADWVEHKLSFEPDAGTTSFFETNIRIVGGLLSAYYLSGDRMFLGRAQELADRLLPAFNTGARDVTFNNDIDITTGAHRKSFEKVLAHWGTIQMEFLALSRETGDAKYWDLAGAPIQALWDDDPATGLLPTRYTPGWRGIVARARNKSTPPAKNGSPSPAALRGDWPGDFFTMGGEADSYYEYLLKTWLLAGESSDLDHHKALYTNAVNMMDELLVQRPGQGAGAEALTYLRTAHIYNVEDVDDAARNIEEMLIATEAINISDGARFIHLPYESSSARQMKPEMQHLACFVPGMLVLGSPYSEQPGRDLRLAADLTETCYAMYGTATGLAGESAVFDRKTGQMKAPTKGNMFNLLRPEAVEAFFYLWRSTGDQKYRDWGWEVFQAFEKNCRMEDGGYTGLRNVSNPEPLGNHNRKMESFFLAETLKYLYLLFSPSDVLPLNEWVFNTEAHPFITSPQPRGAPLEPQPFEATQQKLWEAAASPA